MALIHVIFTSIPLSNVITSHENVKVAETILISTVEIWNYYT